MRFRARKVYGESKDNSCAFCSGVATQETKDGLLVCRSHLNSKLEEIKCTCGSWLEQRTGKFGPYFNCVHCGNINFNKAMEMKSVMAKNMFNTRSNEAPRMVNSYSSLPKKEESFEDRERRMNKEDRKGKEITISSDDVEYFD